FIPTKVEEEPLDPDVNDDRRYADEPTAPRQKCSSCSQTQSRKRQRQSSDNKEDGEICACFEKLEKLGWGEGPMYDTVVLLFGESSVYRKIWLHLKPKSCVNWVENAGEVEPPNVEPRYSLFFYLLGMMHGLLLNVFMKWPSKVTLGRLLPHARGLGFKPRRGGFPSGARKEWGLSPKAKPESCGKWVKNAGIKDINFNFRPKCDRSKCDIIGDPKPLPHNEAPLMEESPQLLIMTIGFNTRVLFSFYNSKQQKAKTSIK
nr:L10-interacting MYB domain-containing protein-like [Tanacetum cinerariifolium]